MRNILAVLITGILVGCSSAPRLQVPRPEGNSMSMALMDKQPSEQRFQLYVLSSSNVLSGSGGMSAFNEKTTWRVELTESESRTLEGQIRAAGWLEGNPAGEHDTVELNSERFLAISLRASSQRMAFDIQAGPKGFGPDTAAILETLRKISVRRFKSHVDGLPGEGDSIR